VVREARPIDSLLHSRFEWDDVRAGEKYREAQARQLIRWVKVEITTQAGKAIQIPAFVNTSVVGKRAYFSVCDAIEDMDLWECVMDDALRYLRGAQKRIRELNSYHDNENMRNAKQTTMTKIKDAIEATTEARERMW